MTQVCHELEIINCGHVSVKRHSFWKITDPFSNLKRFLNYIITGYNSGTVCGRHIAGENSHRCCFPCTIRPKEANDFSLVGIKADIVEGAPCAIVLDKTIDLDHSLSL